VELDQPRSENDPLFFQAVKTFGRFRRMRRKSHVLANSHGKRIPDVSIIPLDPVQRAGVDPILPLLRLCQALVPRPLPNVIPSKVFHFGNNRISLFKEIVL
jgi:hypothetical protein